MTDLNHLLDTLDPQAELVARHLWLAGFFDWVRGDRNTPQASVARVALFLDAVQARPGMAQRVQLWWQTLIDTIDGTTLLADYGFASRSAFVSELAERLRLKILPATPETADAAELFSLVLSHEFDARWITALDEPLLERLAALLQTRAVDANPDWRTPTLWQATIL